MIGGGGLRVPLPCCSIVQCWGCGSTRSSCPWSCPTCFQSHVPAAMLACDEVLSFQRHSGADISMSWDLLHTGTESSLLHIDNFDVGFSGISPVFFVCGLGKKKKCQRCVPACWCLCFQRFSLTGWDCGLQLLVGITSCSLSSARTQAVRQQHGDLVRQCTSSV